MLLFDTTAQSPVSRTRVTPDGAAASCDPLNHHLFGPPDPMMRPAWQLEAESASATLVDVRLPSIDSGEERVRVEDSVERVHLPWDFRVTFPVPLEEAIDAGKIDPSDAEPENLATIHDEHAREALALLSDIDALSDAKVHGVDPKTGKKPRTEKQRKALERLFAEKPTALYHAFDVLMDVYAEVFGDEAGLAFRQALTCWHAGVEVISQTENAKPSVIRTPMLSGEDGLPVSRPLLRAIDEGCFGTDIESGTTIDPGDEEVIAITESFAAKLGAEVGPTGDVSEAYRVMLANYRADFGDRAADVLETL